MVTYEEIKAAAAAVGQVVTTAKSLRDFFSRKPGDSGSDEIRKLLGDLYDQSLDAKQANIALAGRLSDVQRQLNAALDELAKLQQERIDRDKFELKDIGMGSFAYVMKSPETEADRSIRLCATCFDGGKRSVLQRKWLHDGEERLLCHSCKAEIRAGSSEPGRRRQAWADDEEAY